MTQKKNAHCSWWAAYQTHVRGIVLPDREDKSNNISYWRSEIFLNIIVYLVPLSIIALVPGVYMSFLNGIPIIGVADLLAFVFLILTMVSPCLLLRTRKFIFICVFYFLSVLLIYYVGKSGPGMLYLLALTVLSSVIYSSKAGFYSAWVNTIICFGLGILNYFHVNVPILIDHSVGSWIAVTSNLILLSFGCAKCLELLISGLAVSLDEKKISEAKFEKANRLYQFISNINQSIVHIKDEKTLFRTSCHIAFDIGKFKMAWVGEFEYNNKKIVLVDQNGIPEKDILLFTASYENNGPQDYILRTGQYYVCNDVENDLQLKNWKPFAAINDVRSCIVLPIKKEGSIIGSFNLYATEINFFDEAEIALLVEATGDISFALDVFEKTRRHKVAEEIIFKNENRFRSLIEKSTDVKMLTTIKGEFIYGSPSVTKLFGYSIEEFLNKSAFTFFHPDDLPNLIKNRTLIMKSPGQSFSYQYRLLHKNGNWIWCEGTLTNMLHEPGIGAFVSNFRDISERKQAEQALSAVSENLKATVSDLQKIMDSSLDIICSFDGEGKFVKVSNASQQVLGYDSSELLGERYIDMVWREDVEKTNRVALEIMNGTPVTFFENRYLHKNGSLVQILWSAKWDEDSKMMYCIAKDVTERKRGEAERDKMGSDLIQRSKNLEQFSYIVSHNLRGPVANILGISNVLKGKVTMAERNKIQNFLFIAVEQLDEIVKDLNKILAVRLEITENKEIVHFSDLVANIKSSIQNLIQKEDAKILTDFSAIDNILALKSYLYSIFYNLISNSIKYKQPGKVPFIEIRSDVLDGKIRISFKDRGTGIDLEQHGEKLFGLYKRFHMNIEGKGLGLFMVKTQVEILEGSIALKSELNVGTEFIIELPL